ncbi:Alpha,alpha-trehalose-phosphate synthase [Gammaproteobacteria bacterium]
MRMALRFIFPLLTILGGIAWGTAPLVGELVQRWFRTDVELRSQLLFDSIQDTVNAMIASKENSKIDGLFRRIARDERLLALGLCMPNGVLSHRSSEWPKALSCPLPSTASKKTFTVEHLEAGPVLAAVFTLTVDNVELGRLIIVHDLMFIERRSSTAEQYMAVFLAVLGVVVAIITIIVARVMLKGWVQAVRNGLVTSEKSQTDTFLEPEIAPLVREVRKMLRDLDVPRSVADAIRIDWSPESLRTLLRNELPEAQVIVVSNREPYIHNEEEDGRIVVQRPASGLVTALEPICRACGGTWIAHGSGSADNRTVDANNRLGVPPEAPVYILRRIWLSEKEQDGYYYGFANEGLWPLCHIAFVRPIFRASDWEQYVAVNRKFADAVVAEATTPNPVVLVQDYHFALLPRMVRERLPDATIITFWHIPWPNPEAFSICPWREEILLGMLGSSILGFHTQFHCLNFLESVDRFLECNINREQSVVSTGASTTVVRPYPISIEWPPAALANQPSIAACRAMIRHQYGLMADTMLVVGVERFDYTKGIADRFCAVGNLLENHPEWIGRFTMLQIAAPTRSRLPVYRNTQLEAEQMARTINERFGIEGWVPIILSAKHHESDAVFMLYRAADLCLVSSLHDGMNLVAKEFVAARDDEDGVLILSIFAGASRELLEALIVNPYDSNSMGEALHRGLTMPIEQRQERMRLMRDMVGEHNIYFWAGRMLLDAARMRKRQRIEAHIAAVETSSDNRKQGEEK